MIWEREILDMQTKGWCEPVRQIGRAGRVGQKRRIVIPAKAALIYYLMQHSENRHWDNCGENLKLHEDRIFTWYPNVKMSV